MMTIEEWSNVVRHRPVPNTYDDWHKVTFRSYWHDCPLEIQMGTFWWLELCAARRDIAGKMRERDSVNPIKDIKNFRRFLAYIKDEW